MELNTLENVNALSEYKKIEQIAKVEKKIQNLRYVPFLISSVLIFWSLWADWLNALSSSMSMTVFAISIAIIVYAITLRTDLYIQLMDLKYKN